MSNKVYVGNLPFDFVTEDLEKLFSKFGKLEECAMKKGYGFVHFTENEEAETAVKEMEEYELDGRRLRVAFANKPSGRGENGASSRNEGKSRVSKSLFIANIPPEVKIGEMEEYFGRYGKVENIKVLPVVRGNTTVSAFIDFNHEDSAINAHDAELVLGGNTLRSDFNSKGRDARRRPGYDRRGRDDDYRGRRGRDGSFDEPRGRYGRERSRSYDRYRKRSDDFSRRDYHRSPPRYDNDRGNGRGYARYDDRNNSSRPYENRRFDRSRSPTGRGPRRSRSRSR